MNLKNFETILLVIMTFIIIFGCDQNKITTDDGVIIKLEAPASFELSDTMFIHDAFDNIQSMPIKREIDTLQLDGYYALSYKDRAHKIKKYKGSSRPFARSISTNIYVTPGSEIHAIFDTSSQRSKELLHPEYILRFSGDYDEVNNYLRDKRQVWIPVYTKKSFSLDSLNVAESINAALLEEMVHDRFNEFKDKERKSIKYRLYYLYYKYLGESLDRKPRLNDFPEKNNDYNIYDQDSYGKIPDNREMTLVIIHNRSKIKAEEENKPLGLVIMEYLSQWPNGEMKDEMTKSFYKWNKVPDIPGEGYAERIYTHAQKNITDSVISESIRELYEELIPMTSGQPSPAFNLMDQNGKLVSSEDLKGKYVYVDIWATWCAPCIKEVPHLEKLQEEYKGSNILFVSISRDAPKNKQKWKKMILDKNMGGIQLISNKDFEEFVDFYGIKSIPRFILLDPEGNIVSAEAPRPSDDNIRQLIDKLVG